AARNVWRRSRGCLLAIFGRRLADQLLEACAEGSEAFEPNQVTDLRDSEVGGTQQVLGPLHTPTRQVRARGLAVDRGECAREMKLGHICGARHRIERQRLREVAIRQVPS